MSPVQFLGSFLLPQISKPFLRVAHLTLLFFSGIPSWDSVPKTSDAYSSYQTSDTNSPRRICLKTSDSLITIS